MTLKSRHLTLALFIFVLLFSVLGAGGWFTKTASAACTALPTGLGTATFTLSIPADGTYRFWAHAFSPSNGNDAFYLQVDESHCQLTVGNTNIAAGTFKWIDYQNGTATDKINLSLPAGSHTFKLAGLDPSVGVSKIILSADANCVPTGDGANCTSSSSPAATNPGTPPPAAGGTGAPVSGAITLPGAANGGTVTYYLNGKPITGNKLDTTKLEDGTYELKRVEVDASGTTTESTQSIVVDNHTTLSERLVKLLYSPIAWVGSAFMVLAVALLLVWKLRPQWLTAGKEWFARTVLRRPSAQQSLASGVVVYTAHDHPKHQFWRGLFVLSFALVGTTTLLYGFAATNGIGYNTSNATVANGASIVNKSGAIGGKMVQFAASAPATPQPNPTPPPAPSGLSLPRVPWEGGPAYWAQFSKANAAGWTNPNFFPISVFLGKPESPSHVSSLKDAGINLYMGVEHNPPLSAVTSQGIFVMPQRGEWTQAQVGNDPKAVAWFISDECDQGEGECWLNGSTSARVTQQQSWVNTVRGYNDGRFAHANYGNGILRTFWAPGDDMNKFIQMVDSASADKYTYTSPSVGEIIDGGHDAPDWPNGTPVARAYSYGWQADQMRRFQDPARLRPVWTFIETAMPFLNEAGARTITPNQIEGAVWSALIHEARGIAYFQHNNNGQCGTYSIVECPNVHTKVKAINAKVLSLAPVLNTQSYYNKTRVVNGFTYYYYGFDNGTDTMLKAHNSSAYIFAGLGMGHSTGNKTFTLPAGVNGTTVTVVGENRTIPVTNRTFTDNFANEYTHHVYQIPM